MTKEQLIRAFRELKDLGVKRFGIHALLASNTISNDYYPELAKQLFQLAVEVVEKTGVTLDFVNLSGGVGVNYKPEDQPNDIAVIGEGVRRAYEAILIPAGLDQVKIYTELGRFMLAPHGLLVTHVTHKKQTYRTYLGVDASAVNLLRPAMYGAYHHITNLDRPEGETEVVDIVGSLCETMTNLPRIGSFLSLRLGISWSSMIQERMVIPWAISTMPSFALPRFY